MTRKKTVIDLSPVERLYTKSLEEHGTKSIGVGWPDPEMHRLRFDKLVSVIEPDSIDISVNDLGCGYGSLYEYFLENKVNVSTYRGYDISEKMLIEARNRLPQDRVELILGAELNMIADYSIASGIFNVRFDESEADWLEHIKRTLANMYEYSDKGFAFNLLSSYVDYRRDHLFYGDPLFFFDYCKRQFSPYVSLIHDYPLYEWTLIVRKA